MSTEETSTSRTKEIEVKDMYSLVEKSLLKETNSDQPHYIEVNKAQDFCDKYAEQETKRNLEKFLYFLKAEGIVVEEESKPQDFEFLYGVWSGENPDGLL